ncbi:hypothetical protein [Pseudomonas putida]|uniref:Uncharacterized protein n=1 Tax=Pseudomonas putida TaxID=303 RepID=A0A8I1JKP8_PSEPU|nr:hypothetical protein [Pseudomonas putida]MBI6885846.1 hypothetical protein [Pseudomonas putida]
MSKTTGKDIYNDLSSQVEDYSGNARKASRRLESIQSEIADLKRSQAQQIAIIGSEHLAGVMAGRVQAVKPEIQQIFVEREKLIEAAERDYRSAVATANGLAFDVSTAMQKVAQEEGLLKSALANNDELRKAAKTKDDAELAYNFAQRAADAAMVESRQKLEGYRVSRSFNYLLDRGFGTRRYQSGYVFTWLDGWLARRINFVEAKQNFETLTHMPDASRERAAELMSAQTVAIMHYNGLVSLIEKRSGVAAAKSALKAAQSQKDRTDEVVERTKRTRDAFSAKRDNHYADMKSRVTKALEAMSSEQMRILVLATRGNEDDVALAKLVADKSTIVQLGIDEQVAQAEYDRLSVQSRRAKDALEYFERQDYDGKRRVYDRSFDAEALLAGYVLGHIDQSRMDSMIRSSSRVEPEPQPEPVRQTTTSSYSSSDDDDSYSSSRQKSDDAFGGASPAWQSGDDSFGGGSQTKWKSDDGF